MEEATLQGPHAFGSAAKASPPRWSLYLHIPFCRQACTYCDFHFSTQLDQRDGVVAALVAEIQSTADAAQAQDRRLATVYAGGGTPSVLTISQWERIMDALRAGFSWDAGAEVTLEVNPEDVSEANLNAWRRLGFNRFSMGVQTFDDRDLQALNRPHTGAQAVAALRMAQDAGFTNLSIDLIYGLPFGNWEKTWETALELNIPHLSAYALTVEPRTALHAAVRKGSVRLPEEGAVADQARLLRTAARAAGWNPYEVSNLAQPGWEAVHNQRYWSGTPYYGLGPGAHGFDGHWTRTANVSNNAAYTRYWAGKRLESDPPVQESERLTSAQRWNEWALTSLRTAKGLRWEDMPQELRTGAVEWQSQSLEALKLAESRGWVAPLPNDAGWAPTEEGWLWSDALAESVFIV